MICKSTPSGGLTSIELFAGAGGLALAVAQSGFQHAAVVELDKHACETIRENQRCGFPEVKGWPLHEIDIREFDYHSLNLPIDLVSGGPPCQPFSHAGKRLGRNDSRDMFPEAIRAVEILRPKAFIFENVNGIMRPSLVNYLEYIRLRLSYPHISREKNEKWTSHRLRLEQHHLSGATDEVYRLAVRALDAADYGVPQRRRRVFLVGVRTDLKVEWSFPEPTHKKNRLLYDKWISGDYWERHEISRKRRGAPPPEHNEVLRGIRDNPPDGQPWISVRDAISSLPDPEKFKGSGLKNHDFVEGARVYPGHTGSLLDEPAKTLKAGDHGVPGGENMLVKDDGTVRYFTMRESARLQTFPDKYVFTGPWGRIIRQLGNAVPVKLGQVIVSSLKKAIQESTVEKTQNA